MRARSRLFPRRSPVGGGRLVEVAHPVAALREALLLLVGLLLLAAILVGLIHALSAPEPEVERPDLAVSGPPSVRTPGPPKLDLPSPRAPAVKVPKPQIGSPRVPRVSPHVSAPNVSAPNVGSPSVGSPDLAVDASVESDDSSIDLSFAWHLVLFVFWLPWWVLLLLLLLGRLLFLVWRRRREERRAEEADGHA